MSFKSNGLIVIGENFNATRKIKATSPRVLEENDKWGIKYTDLDGTERILDVTAAMPDSEAARANFMIPHIGEACRTKDMTYITYALKAQERAGAHIIDLCVDEMSVYPEERHDWMRWLVKTAQGITDSVVSIDSSDSETIRAGLEVHDSDKSRPAINSVNLEPGRQVLVGMARERKAILFANASGDRGMPQNADERVEHLDRCMEMMDKGDIPMEDRFLDPLVFPVGAGSDFGDHYLGAVRALREKYPDVHIFGGHSNVSFGLPRRKLVNQTFLALSILAGCDAVMVDPLMNSPEELDDFNFAASALTGKDEFSVKFIKHCRQKAKRKSA